MDAGSLLVCDFLISYAASPAPLSLPEATASRDGEKMGGDQASTTQPNYHLSAFYFLFSVLYLWFQLPTKTRNI